ncbi:hypothetical protein HYN59_16970 [Flavobacterium album]|uniref:SnoaL-like domain-containing protein n=1 Tax=Flavobacterium album TaxID=2175091 RepID=A0A2S1R1U5_9FLAO|nr:hypothetical protein [Flavobacterium album]AWH86693.1 hypothetical protein HYN59_16970 [Flavobacterium album]
MKTILLLLCLITGLGARSQGVNGALDNVILTQADAMGKAFIAKDYAAFVKYSHPTVVQMMGGKAKMAEDTKKSFEEFEAEGVVFVNVTFGPPSKILVVGGEMQCTFNEMIEMRIPGGKLTAFTNVIAISNDNGANWYFIDCSENNAQAMRKLIPSLSPELILPEPIGPAFEEDPKP